MQTDIGDEISKLKSLSDTTDLIIYQHNRENEIVDKWFTAIKETANAIINSSNSKKSGPKTSECPEIPDLLSTIKGEQLQTKNNRVSSLLAVAQKNHARLSHRKSLRKLVLEKKSNNRWEISNSKLSEDQIIEEESDHNKEDASKSSLRRSTLDKKTNVCNQKENSYSTPQQSEVLVPNSIEKTPATRSKTKDINPVVTLKKLKQISSNKKFCTQDLTPDIIQKKTTNNKNVTSDDQILDDKKSMVSDHKVESGYKSNSHNETITLDSSQSEESVETQPRTRSKRKSSIQLVQEKVKKAKNSSSESKLIKRAKALLENSTSGSQNPKRIRVNKNAKNAVIQPKTSGVSSQLIAAENEKRILREIQKKEELVSQNTKKLKTMRQMKIEESKKTRELKMEKAMQQRLKIQSEKKEKMKCRTVSKQENVQQKELNVKKTAPKKIQAEDKVDSVKKITPTSAQKVNQSTTLKIQDEKAPSGTPKKAPPKPVRTPIRKAEPSPEKQIVKDAKTNAMNQTFTNPSAEVLSTSKELFAKPSPLNSTYVAKAVNLTSTPTAKKTESKTHVKTPVSSLNKKNNSYTMTPHESSFVSYDVSEIKSDDSDEEESSNNKPIPSWASGIRLRNALLNQQYNPIDTAEMFGNYFETPDLAEIMGVTKKQYLKRTSSAIWINSPNRSLLY